MDQILGTWVPTWVMIIVVSVLTLCLFIGVPLASKAGKRRGRRLAHPEQFTNAKDKAKDTALFLAALIPSLLVWLAVMGVSFIGLRGFAADMMRWDNWTNVLVPLSLDGISVSFGAWAFVAVKRGRHPGRAYKIVLAAALVSATLNFVHGRTEWSVWAGGYLAFLSLVGMAMFHELLDQFMAAYDDELALKTKNPRFGLRWILAPVSTFVAWRTWIVYPPQEATRPSVRNALDHRAAWVEANRTAKLETENAVFVQQQKALVVKATAKAEAERAQASLTVPAPPPAPLAQYAPAGYPPGGYNGAVTNPVNGHPVAAGHALPNGHTGNGYTSNGHAAASAVNGVTLTPLERTAGAARPEPIPAQFSGNHRDPHTDSGELTMSQRDLSAAMDQPARDQIADWLRSEQRVTSTRVCDWVRDEVRSLNQEWRPSEAWAKQRIRDVKAQLGLPAASEDLADASR